MSAAGVLAVLADAIRYEWKAAAADSWIAELVAAHDAVAELIAADEQLIEMCDELVRVNNKTLGRGAVRIQAAIIDRFLRKVERNRAALACCKGAQA